MAGQTSIIHAYETFPPFHLPEFGHNPCAVRLVVVTHATDKLLKQVGYGHHLTLDIA